jgi:hypothetical protein
MFTVFVVTSAVFASGLVNVSRTSLFGTPIYPDSPDSVVFVDPGTIIKDYLNDPGYQIGNTFQVHVNITGAVDLFAYQVNVTWNPAILSYSGLTYGEFLARTGSAYGTSRTQPTLKADNVAGYVSVAETILGDVAGITGNGRLFTISFLIMDYGATPIGIGMGGELPTRLLESTGADHAYTVTDGYFRNGLTGDANLDRTINVFDILAVKSRWNGTPASPDWIREYDVNDDAAINVFDILTVKANWGRTVP